MASDMPDLMDERKNLVSTHWLADKGWTAPDIVIVDASYYLPDAGRDGRAEYEEQRIPGAVFFDIDDIADTNSPLPHMMPSAEKFSSRVRKLGIGDGTRVVVYDGAGLFSAARVWWMLRTFGHQDVAILDGGFPKWQADGLPVDNGTRRSRASPGTSRPGSPAPACVTRRMCVRAIESGSAQLADARSPGRFKAEEPEPREGMRGGHMPGAVERALPNSAERRWHGQGRLQKFARCSRRRAWTLANRSSRRVARA
jgi:thiosulfate/3-mercaptopyruvate sulfurtransferase